jgi:hypothetical protein
MVYLDKYIFIFGGYDGTRRTNDFYKYDISKLYINLVIKQWHKIITNDMPPSPRERHVAGLYLITFSCT